MIQAVCVSCSHLLLSHHSNDKRNELDGIFTGLSVSFLPVSKT